MTTNKQDVRRYDDMGSGQICPINNMYESDGGDYVLYVDYKALQAELKKAVAALINGRFTRCVGPAGWRPPLGNIVNTLIDRIDSLEDECGKLRARTSCTMGIGRGDGRLFVHGDYDSIKAAQKMVLELEAVRDECERWKSSASGAHQQLTANRIETEKLAVDWSKAMAECEELRKASAELADWCLHGVGADTEVTPGLQRVMDITGVVYLWT